MRPSNPSLCHMMHCPCFCSMTRPLLQTPLPDDGDEDDDGGDDDDNDDDNERD